MDIWKVVAGNMGAQNMKMNIGYNNFWVSVKRAEDCLFSRRNGYRGKIILGYSVCIRLFGYNLVWHLQPLNHLNLKTITACIMAAWLIACAMIFGNADKDKPGSFSNSYDPK